MKKLLLTLSFFGILTSCSDNSNLDNIEISGTFIHQIPNCDNSQNPEEGCVELVWFNDNSMANLMVGGCDFGINTTYSRTGDKIYFTYETGLKATISFKIQSDTVLVQIENNQIWNKEEL